MFCELMVWEKWVNILSKVSSAYTMYVLAYLYILLRKSFFERSKMFFYFLNQVCGLQPKPRRAAAKAISSFQFSSTERAPKAFYFLVGQNIEALHGTFIQRFDSLERTHDSRWS